MTHFIRLNQEQFASTEPFLLTKFEDPYQVGDKLILQEEKPRELYEPQGVRTGNERTLSITRVARNEPGIFKGYCILVFADKEEKE